MIGIDWNTPVSVAKSVGEQYGKVLQGNFDPANLYATPEVVAEQAKSMLQQFGKQHIANLGHGVYPVTPLDSVKAFVDTVKQYSY